MAVDLWLRRAATTSTRRRRPAAGRRSDRAPADMPGRPAKDPPDIRQEKVAQIRQALDAGCYDLDARLHEMLNDLAAGLAAPSRNRP